MFYLLTLIREFIINYYESIIESQTFKNDSTDESAGFPPPADSQLITFFFCFYKHGGLSQFQANHRQSLQIPTAPEHNSSPSH